MIKHRLLWLYILPDKAVIHNHSQISTVGLRPIIYYYIWIVYIVPALTPVYLKKMRKEKLTSLYPLSTGWAAVCSSCTYMHMQYTSFRWFESVTFIEFQTCQQNMVTGHYFLFVSNYMFFLLYCSTRTSSRCWWLMTGPRPNFCLSWQNITAWQRAFLRYRISSLLCHCMWILCSVHRQHMYK